MDDAKRKSNKIKRKKREVKNVVALYLQRRNYCNLQTFLTSKKQQLVHSVVETSVGRANSILYRCDPVVLDQNFTKFVLWLRDQTKFKNRFHDIESIVAPLFCHLYMEILRYEHIEKAASFFRCHFPSINETKCDSSIRDVIFAEGGSKDKDISKFKERFRSNRIVLKLHPDSLKNLRKFVLENCHIVFLQVLQTYFDFQVNEFVKKGKRRIMTIAGNKKDSKYQKYFNCLRELKRLTLPIFNVNISCNKHDVPCGLLRRQCGLVIFAQYNVIHLMPLHSLDSLFSLNGTTQMKFSYHSNLIYSVDLSPDNQILVSGSADNSLCIYNLETMSLVKKCTGHLGAIYCVKISGNGVYVATGSMDGTTRLWQIKTGKVLRIFCGHTQAVTCVEFHPNCLYLATGSADRNIRLWCINKASSLRLLHASKGTVYGLAFSPCGKLLASASEDKSIRVWDVLTSKVVIELRCKDAPILKLIFNTNGSEICAGTIDGVLRIWNVSRVQDNGENSKYLDPTTIQSFNAKLLSIEYAFSTYGILTA